MHPAHHTARVRRCGSTRAHGHSLSPLAADLAAGELLSCGWGGTFGKQLRPPSFPNIVVRITSSTNRSKADIERADGGMSSPPPRPGGERGGCNEEPVTAAQVALLQRGEEILAARPPLAHGAAHGPASMRSTSAELDEGAVQRLAGAPRGRAAEASCGRYVRQAAVGLSMAVLVCCVLLLQLGREASAPRREAPVVLSTSVLAGEELDWLGGGPHGDPYPASDGESSHRRAHIARAALQAESAWKSTVGHLFDDWQSGGGQSLHMGGANAARVWDAARPFAPPRDREPQGRLLSPAKEGQRLWNEQIQAMQAGELQANREIMNTVSLLKQDKHESDAVHSTWNPPAGVKLSAAADRKAAAHARLTALAAKKRSVQTPGAPAPAHKQQAPTAKTVAGGKVAAGKTGALKAATEKLSQPTREQVLNSVSVKPVDLSALDVATSESSRAELSSFFDSLAAHDEAKHVLHEARYPHRQSMRQVLPTSIMPAKPPKKEVDHLQHEVTWLRKRVEVLQDALLKGGSSRAAAVGKHAGAANATHALPSVNKAGDAKSVPPQNAPPKAAADKSLPSQEYIALTRPPPRGCPLFAAPGERLPADCPRYLAPAPCIWCRARKRLPPTGGAGIPAGASVALRPRFVVGASLVLTLTHMCVCWWCTGSR